MVVKWSAFNLFSPITPPSKFDPKLLYLSNMMFTANPCKVGFHILWVGEGKTTSNEWRGCVNDKDRKQRKITKAVEKAKKEDQIQTKKEAKIMVNKLNVSMLRVKYSKVK